MIKALPTIEGNSLSMGWNNENEIQSWKKCLFWWVGKCSFCASKGLYSSYIQHSLASCHRGGAQQRRKELGKCIYLEGILSQAGCRHCSIPYEFCKKWQRHNGKWELSAKPCQYGKLVYDTVIGLFYCDDERYRMDVYTTIKEEGDTGYWGLSDEHVAIWLGTELKMVDMECSRFIRTFAV